MFKTLFKTTFVANVCSICIPLSSFATSESEESLSSPTVLEQQEQKEPEQEEPPQVALEQKEPKQEQRWYLEAKPGYYYFTDKEMREFFDNGGFTIRGEAGYRFWKPLAIWLDVGYFQKEGHAMGGSEELDIKLVTFTLGLKGIFYVHEIVALYAGVGPRLFMALLHNNSPFVRGEDDGIGIGGGFQGGVWLFPFPRNRNIFFDFFIDYSHKGMEIEEDETSSLDFDIDVSGITAGAGLGIRF